MARQRKTEASDFRDGPDDTEKSAIAKAVIRPSLHGAATVQTYSKWVSAELGLKELVSAFAEQTEAVINGDLDRAEAMLTVQAHTLDTIYNSLARKAMNAELLSQFETFLKLALRAQSQCRSTWESLSAIKNPPMVGYIRQANIAHGPQQVNNETSTRTREIQKAPNKVLEGTEHEPDQWLDVLDGGTPTKAAGTDSAVEAVGEIDGPEDKGGQG